MPAFLLVLVLPLSNHKERMLSNKFRRITIEPNLTAILDIDLAQLPEVSSATIIHISVGDKSNLNLLANLSIWNNIWDWSRAQQTLYSFGTYCQLNSLLAARDNANPSSSLPTFTAVLLTLFLKIFDSSFVTPSTSSFAIFRKFIPVGAYSRLLGES